MKLNTQTKRILQIGLLAAFALPLLIYVLIGFSSRPYSDDFCYATTTSELSVIGSVLNSYQTWTGRIFNVFVVSAISSLGSWGVRLFPPTLILTWMICLYWVLYQISRYLHLKSYRLAALLLTMVIVLSTFSGSPQLEESVYWLAGAVTYTLPLIFFTIAFGLVVTAFQQQIRWIFAVFPLLVFVGGTLSEPYATLQIMALLLALPIAFHFSRLGLAILLIFGLIASMLALGILLAAPGNSVRQSNFQLKPSIVSAGIDTLIHTAAFIIVSVSDFSPSAALVILVHPAFLTYQLTSSDTLTSTTRRNVRLLAMATLPIGFILIGAFMFPAMYTTSMPPPARGYIMSQAILIGCLEAI